MHNSPDFPKASLFNAWYFLMALCFFGGIFSIIYVGHFTLVTGFFISKVLAFFSVIGMLIPRSWYKKNMRFSVYEVFLFNLLALGPGITSILLWLNFLIPLSSSSEVYMIAKSDSEGAYSLAFSGKTYIFTYEQNALYNFPELRTFDASDAELMFRAKAIEYKFSKGLLGFKVVKGYTFLAY